MNFTRLLSLLLISTLAGTCLRAQTIDSILVYPSFTPSHTDTVKIYTYMHFPSGPCAGTSNHSQVGFNIGASGLHCLGPLSILCGDIDTTILPPPHMPGTFRYVYVLNAGFGGPPCTPGIVPSDMDTTYYMVMGPTTSNLPPKVFSNQTDTICKNDTAGPQTFTIVDEDINGVVVNAYSTNQLVLPNTNVVLSGSGGSRTVTGYPASGQTGQAIIYVVATDTAGSKDSAAYEINIVDCDTMPTEISNSSLANLKIFPNPAKNVLYIEGLAELKTITLNLTDIRGRSVLSSTYTAANRIEIPVDQLPKGLYFIMVKSEGIQHIEKILIE